MSDWVKDLYLQVPVPDPWIKWTLEDLERAEADPSYPEPERRKIRVELRMRRAGKTLAASQANPEAK